MVTLIFLHEKLIKTTAYVTTIKIFTFNKIDFYIIAAEFHKGSDNVYDETKHHETVVLITNSERSKMNKSTLLRRVQSVRTLILLAFSLFLYKKNNKKVIFSL